MKKTITFCIIITIAAIINQVASQTCTPDHTGVPTVPASGILLPSPLPHATVGIAYIQPITFGVPASAQGFTINWIKYNHMSNFIPTNTNWNIVDSSGGILFAQWAGVTWHCATLLGTPTTAGTDSIIIYVDANVMFGGFPYTQPNVKAFSLPLIVDVATNAGENASTATSLIESHPNPFSTKTQIGFTSAITETSTLNVYSNLGQLVYTEAKIASAGQNYFTFDGSSLSIGTYLYTVTTSDKIFRKKLIKME